MGTSRSPFAPPQAARTFRVHETKAALARVAVRWNGAVRLLLRFTIGLEGRFFFELESHDCTLRKNLDLKVDH
jgi:hypothetical protein